MNRSNLLKSLSFARVSVIFLVLASAGCVDDSAKPAKNAKGLPFAPEFSLKDANGKTRELKEWKDSVVFVHFWASWCGPCRPEIQEILEVAKKTDHDSKGRKVYWVFITEDENFENARKVLDDRKLPSHLFSLMDVEEKTAAKYGTFQYPETYVLDAEHAILDKRIGAQDWRGDEGKAVFSRALQ